MINKKVILGLMSVVLVCGMMSLISHSEAESLAGSDSYKVIKVDGKIVFQKTNTEMKSGDQFIAGTELKFQTPQSRAAVISQLKGRFVLSASEKGQTKILPAANNISSRAGALINLIDLQNHFKGKYLVIGEMRLQLGAEAFPMNEENFFYLSYDYKGETIRKKLDFEDDFLIISKDEIFKIDGEPIPVEEKEMTLFYRQNDTSKKISDFTPVFPDLDNLKVELEIILEEYENKDSETKIKEITAYLNEFYGNPQKDNLGTWLKDEFGIE